MLTAPASVRTRVALAAAAILLLLPASALADVAILDNIVNQFRGATSGWRTNLLPLANSLFLTLATLEFILSGIWWALDPGGAPSVLSALLRRVFALSFFYMLLLNAGTWMPALINSFLQAGQIAGGASVGLSPSAVMGQGIDLATSLWSEMGGDGFLPSLSGALLAVLCSLTVLLAFGFIAAQFVILLVEMYIVVGGGVLLLAFAGNRFSIGFAEKYLGYAFAIGVKGFVLMLIVSVGSGLVSVWHATIPGGGFEDYLAVVAASLIFVAVAWQVPAFASALIAGMPALGLGAVTSGVAGAAAMAVPAAGVAARAAGAGVAAASYGVAASRAAGGGAAGHAVRGLGGELRGRAGQRIRSTFFGPVAHGLQQRRAMLRVVPPPSDPPGS